ncbi:MAG TPA: SUMF1/EgtB/PvdO family nonheme iron enzyme, partial [Flavisolibacter sp.]|nr:SUMF1/EgtB/PvdO family nonheme iron enzyme [Flavisolibacter sp.]
REQIFIDVDTIPPGEDFIDAIEKAVSSCDVLLAIIGKDWLQIKDRFGRRMLDNTSDFVRTEIRAALQRNIRVIPVLVEEADIPNPEDLPDDLKPLTRRNAIELSHTRFHSDVDRLIKAIQKTISDQEAKAKVKAEEEKRLQEQRLEQQKEDTHWQTALQENSVDAFTSYLHNYANGRYAAEASRKIEALQTTEEEKKIQQALAQGTQAFERKEYQQALKYLEEALRLDPENKPSKELIGKCRYELEVEQREQQQKKEEEIRQQKKLERLRLKEQEKRAAETQRMQAVREAERQADKHRKAGRFQEALALYEEALNLQPNREYSRQWAEQCRREIKEKQTNETTDNTQNSESREPIARPRLSKRWLVAGSAILLLALLFFFLRNSNSPSEPTNAGTAQKVPVNTKPAPTGNRLPPVKTESPLSMVSRQLFQDMVPVSGGVFTMGLNKTKFESPAHEVTVGPFRLSKYEITRAQWNTVMDTPRYTASLQVPATNITWDEVQQFIKKLNASSGRPVRLPTEAEWEYACLLGYNSGDDQNI